MFVDTFPSPDELKGAVQGTWLYLSIYLAIFIPFQSFSKFYLVKKKRAEAKAKGDKKRISLADVKYYNKTDLLALVGDRTVGNFMEFAIVFLPLLWIHALFVPGGCQESFTICVIYSISRMYYPIALSQGFAVMLSTVPGYVTYLYLFAKVGWAMM
uniref:Uncharacterized protein n=1 Tax=Craspedostauros australis TaxID=1486917 RepID=A0A7R9ZLY4_9STRA|mmetsp:Transcript_19784/g.55012  ORF Transcript_19784/g.55012 Transcript_19784/m.55012 type:complete len:156 (+) Transcript_19784:250-717(+)